MIFLDITSLYIKVLFSRSSRHFNFHSLELVKSLNNIIHIVLLLLRLKQPPSLLLLLLLLLVLPEASPLDVDEVSLSLAFCLFLRLDYAFGPLFHFCLAPEFECVSSGRVPIEHVVPAPNN